jgi:hypothetical protein
MSEEDWKAKLPEAVKASSLLQGIDSEEKFWKRVQDQHSYAGNSIRIPSDDADEAARAEFRSKLMNKVPSLMEVPGDDDDEGYAGALKKLGRPEKIDEYVPPKTEGYELNEAELDHLRGLASAADMTKRQFKNLVKRFVEDASGSRTEYENARAQDTELLKKEWGVVAEDRMKEVLDFAKRSGAPEHLVRAIEAGTAKANELLWLHGLIKSGKETAAVVNQDGITTNAANESKLSPYEAEERLNEIYNNPKHPFHKADPRAIKRVTELVAMAAGN